jgi:hypothetical protein
MLSGGRRIAHTGLTAFSGNGEWMLDFNGKAGLEGSTAKSHKLLNSAVRLLTPVTR